MKPLSCLPLVAVSLLYLSVAGAAPSDKKGAADKTVITSVDKAGKKHVVQGYTPMKAAPGAKKFAASPKIKAATLPRKVDLRPQMTPVEDQGETSSCVANAVAGSFEYWVKRAAEKEVDVSRLFIYYNARWRSGDQDKDDGSVIQLAMEGLKEFGACSEESWPFSKPLLLVKPNRDAYQEASTVKIKEMAQVPMELEAWKQALASGYPIVFGCLLFESFDECNRKGGVVPMPNPKDLSRASHGGHSMCVVGYSDTEKVFIVRNSWGDQWGDKGYCYMPYNYLLNPKFNDGDAWVFVPEVPLTNPEVTWSNDDKPVTNDGRGVDFDINPYPIEIYKEVEFLVWEELVIEYDDTPPGQYVQYVEYAEADKWEEMESYDTTDLIESWEKENPDEEASLDDDEGEDVGPSPDDEMEEDPDQDPDEPAAEEDAGKEQNPDGEEMEEDPNQDPDEPAVEEDANNGQDADGEEMEEDPNQDPDEPAVEEDADNGQDADGEEMEEDPNQDPDEPAVEEDAGNEAGGDESGEE